jgi:hypothetical protein
MSAIFQFGERLREYGAPVLNEAEVRRSLDPDLVQVTHAELGRAGNLLTFIRFRTEN